MQGRGSVRRAADGSPLRTAAPRRLTSLVMGAGAVLGAICFAAAGLVSMLGHREQPRALTDVAAIIAGVVALDPWAIASLGTVIIILTPLVTLLTTAGEYASIGDRRTVGLAMLVLGVLACAVVLAVAR